MNPTRKFTRDTILAILNNMVSILAGIALLIILTKTLGAELYGMWSQIQITVLLLLPFASLHLGTAMTRFLAAERDKNKIGQGVYSIVCASSLVAVILCIIMFALAKPLSATVFGDPNAVFFIKVSVPLVFLTTLDYLITEYFIAFRQMGRYLIFVVIQSIGQVALISYLVFSGFGLLGAIIALLIIRALLFLIGFLVIRPEIKLSIPSLSVLKPYLVFSLPLLPFALSLWIVQLSDRYIIGYFLGLEAVGIYSAAYSLGNVVAFFWAPMSFVLLPTITNFYEDNKIQEVKTYTSYSLKFYLVFAIPALFGLSVLSRPLLQTMTTSEFVSGYFLIPIIALATLLFKSSFVNANILQLLKKTKRVALIYALSALVNIVINFILIPLIGILGAAISTLVAFSVHFVISHLASRELPFDIDLKFITKCIISSAIMGAVVFVLNPAGATSIIVSIVVGAAVYFLALTLLKGVRREEYAFLTDIVVHIFR